MARPHSINDLPDYLRTEQVVHIDPRLIEEAPTVAAAMLEAYAQAVEKSPHRLKIDGLNLVRVATHDELLEHLETKQGVWDQGKADYEAALAGNPPEYRYKMAEYCRAEGLPLPAEKED